MICLGFQRSLGLAAAAAAAAAFSFSTVCQGAGLGKGWENSQESWADSLAEKCNFSEHSENAGTQVKENSEDNLTLQRETSQV